MQSRKQSLDVGKLLTGLRDRGSNSPGTVRAVRSVSARSAAPQAAETDTPDTATGTRAGAAVRVGGIVLRRISAGDYRAIQNHIAAGGQVDIMFVFS